MFPEFRKRRDGPLREPGLMQYVDSKLESVISLVSDGMRVFAVYIVRNPEKLKDLSA